MCSLFCAQEPDPIALEFNNKDLFIAFPTQRYAFTDPFTDTNSVTKNRI